jgi:large subunit ribosomal protein L25
VHIVAGDIKLANDETLLDEADALVVQIVAPRSGGSEDEAAEGEAAAE